MPRVEVEIGEAGGELPRLGGECGKSQDLTEVRTEKEEREGNTSMPKTQTVLNHEIVSNDCYIVAVTGAIARARSREKQGAESTKKMLEDAIGIMQRKEEAIDRCQVGRQGVREIRKTMTHIVKSRE